jgi:hypothetical protein
MKERMAREGFWRSVAAIVVSVGAMWAVADVVAALVTLPLAAGLDWATRRRRELAGQQHPNG